jgi:hypothetical protein
MNAGDHGVHVEAAAMVLSHNKRIDFGFGRPRDDAAGIVAGNAGAQRQSERRYLNRVSEFQPVLLGAGGRSLAGMLKACCGICQPVPG